MPFRRRTAALSLPLLLPLLFAAVSLGAEELTLFSFETPEKLALWRLRGSRLQISGWPDPMPGSCARITMPQLKPGGERWPAIILDAPRLPADWSNAQELRFELFAESAGVLKLSLHSKSSVIQPELAVEKGRHQIRVPLPEKALDYAHMTHLQFYMDDPDRDYVWYVGDVTLVKADPQARFDELAAKRRRLEIPDRLPPELARRVGQLEESHRALRKLLARPGGDIKRLSALLDDWAGQLSEVEYRLQEHRLAALAGRNGLLALFAGSTEQVHRERMLFLNPPVADGRLSAAANEGESIQLVLRAPQALAGVSVALSAPPQTSDGRQLPLTAVTVAPVGYVKAEQPPYAVSRTGFWPDPLLTYADAVNLDPGQWQSFWIDVNVPAGQPAGEYRTEVAVKAGDAELLRLPLRIEVRNFELPPGTPYPNVFAVFEPPKPDRRTLDDPIRWRREVWDELLRHRMNPTPLYTRRALPVIDARKLKEHGMKSFNVIYGIGDVDAYIRALTKAYPAYRHAGLEELAYCYVFDEAQVTLFPSMREKMLKVKAALPEVKFMTTAYDHSLGEPGSPLAGVVDIWCPMTTKYELIPAQIAAARARGERVWWYVANKPHPPYAAFLLENPWLSMRLLMGAKAWKFQPDGFLYYSSALWYDPAIAPLKDLPPMKGAPLTNWPGRTIGQYNGDGVLIYPAAAGPIPSLRIKQIRDGLEDYQYWALLKQALENADGQSEAWRRAARRELAVEPEIVESMTVYARDPAVLAAKRERLAQLLEEYYAGKE